MNVKRLVTTVSLEPLKVLPPRALTEAEVKGFVATLEGAARLSPDSTVLLKHQNGTAISTRYALQIRPRTHPITGPTDFRLFAVHWDWKAGKAGAPTGLNLNLGPWLKRRPFLGHIDGDMARRTSVILDLDRAGLLWAKEEGFLAGTDYGAAYRESLQLQEQEKWARRVRQGGLDSIQHAP